MKRKISLFLVLMLVLGLLAGCGGDSNAGSKSVDEVDIAYYAFNAEPISTWDPSIMYSTGSIVLCNVYETLLRYNASDDEYENVLAEDYSTSEDGLTWTFELRKGIKFHDGTDFTSEAVKYSIERTIEIGRGAAFIWDAVDKINIIDEHTVEIKLSYAAPIDMIVSSPYGAFIMSPESVKNNGDDWFEQGNEAGTGPYTLDSFAMGDEVVLNKFNDYWKGWDGEHFDKIIIKKITESSSRRQMIEKGECDFTGFLPVEDIQALKENSSVDIIEISAFTNLFAFFNTEVEPLKDVRIRKALAYAFPYDDVINYAVGGYATQSIGPIPKGHWGHSSDLLQYNYNLSKSKQLLEEAGIKEGELKLLLTYASGDETEKKTAELYKAELSKIGVELEIRAMPWESQWEMGMSEDPQNRQDIFMIYWWPDIANPYSWLFSLFNTEEKPLFNLSYYKNEEFDKLIDNGYTNSGVNRDEAEKDFIKAQEILIEDCPGLFVFDRKDVWAANSTFKGFKYNPVYSNVVFFYDCYREK